jgi:hypothetical protein
MNVIVRELGKSYELHSKSGLLSVRNAMVQRIKDVGKSKCFSVMEKIG